MNPDPQSPLGLGRLGKLRRDAGPREWTVPPRTDGDEDAVELDRLTVGDDAVVGRCREPLGDLLPRFVRRIEIVIARADHKPRHRAQALEIFPHHHGLRPAVDDRCKLEQISCQHHHVEVRSDLEYPIELWQRYIVAK